MITRACAITARVSGVWLTALGVKAEGYEAVTGAAQSRSAVPGKSATRCSELARRGRLEIDIDPNPIAAVSAAGLPAKVLPEASLGPA